MFSTQIVILCGGHGTRLKDLTGPIPKCVFKIQKKPFMYYMMSHLMQYKDWVKNFVLCCSDKVDIIKKELLSCSDHYNEWDTESLMFRGKRVILAGEDEPKGTFSGVMSALPYIKTSYILIINGDTFCPVDLGDIKRHHTKPAKLSVGVYNNIHSGVWFMNTAFLKSFKDKNYILREELIPEESDNRIVAYNTPSFIDIGTPEGLMDAEKFHEFAYL